MSTGSVSVVIVTFNSADLIAPCLRSLHGASTRPIDVIVVDNNSTDRTVDAANGAFSGLTLIRNVENRYYAAASNQGIQAAKGVFILLLNPDTILPIGGIDALVGSLALHPNAAALAPMLILPDGSRQASLRELPGLDTLWYDLLGLSFLFPRSRPFDRWRMGYFDGLTPRSVDQPSASCLLVRREALERVGVFDESYPMFFNDVDWCRRVKEAGMTIWYDPDVKISHHGGATVGKYRLKMIWMGHAAYFLYLRRLYRRDPILLSLTYLSWPPLMLAAAARSAWHVGNRQESPTRAACRLE